MGKRKDQDTVFAERIRQLPAILYPILLSRALAPFSKAKTGPFRASGHPGDRFIYIRYCPDRNTRTPLGRPEFVLGVVGQLLALNAPVGGEPVHDPTNELLSHPRSGITMESSIVNSGVPVHLPQTTTPSDDKDSQQTPAKAEAYDLSHCGQESVIDVGPSILADNAAANAEASVQVSTKVPPGARMPTPSKNDPASSRICDLLRSTARGIGRLSDSYWKLPAASTSLAGLLLLTLAQFAQDDTQRDASTYAAAQGNLPQLRSSEEPAANASRDVTRRLIDAQASAANPLQSLPGRLGRYLRHCARPPETTNKSNRGTGPPHPFE